MVSWLMLGLWGEQAIYLSGFGYYVPCDLKRWVIVTANDRNVTN